MAGSPSSTKSEPVEVGSSKFQPNKEGELLVDISIEQPPFQIIEKVAPVEQPPTEINEEIVVVVSSPPREQAINAITELVFQTPPATKSTPESTVGFYSSLL